MERKIYVFKPRARGSMLSHGYSIMVMCLSSSRGFSIGHVAAIFVPQNIKISALSCRIIRYISSNKSLFKYLRSKLTEAFDKFDN